MYKGQFDENYRYSAKVKFFGYPQWLEEISRKYCVLTGNNENLTYKRYLYLGSNIKYKDKDLSIDFINDFFSLTFQNRQKILNCIELENINTIKSK